MLPSPLTDTGHQGKRSLLPGYFLYQTIFCKIIYLLENDSGHSRHPNMYNNSCCSTCTGTTYKIHFFLHITHSPQYWKPHHDLQNIPGTFYTNTCTKFQNRNRSPQWKQWHNLIRQWDTTSILGTEFSLCWAWCS